jgi:hypothetical protein
MNSISSFTIKCVIERRRATSSGNLLINVHFMLILLLTNVHEAFYTLLERKLYPGIHKLQNHCFCYPSWYQSNYVI